MKTIYKNQKQILPKQQVSIELDAKINQGINLNKKQWQKVVKELTNIPDYDASKQLNELLVHQVPFFTNLLTEQARKVYENPAYNTVYEWNENLKPWRIKDWIEKIKMYGRGKPDYYKPLTDVGYVKSRKRGLLW